MKMWIFQLQQIFSMTKKYEISLEDANKLLAIISEIPIKYGFDGVVILKNLKEIEEPNLDKES